MLAPIVLFVYNRPDHTLKTLEALMLNDMSVESELYIFSDGPKIDASPIDFYNIDQVRKVIRNNKWCGKVHIIESAKNKGLANSILEGVTEVIKKYGKVIVLEDDIITTKGFIRYMNEALVLYEDESKVMHISGYQYPLENKIQSSTCFLKILSCWGWATWKRSWDQYEHNIELHYQRWRSPEKQKKFNINGHADFFEQIELNRNGVIYSWAVRWYASWLYAGGYALFPQYSLVHNNGMDGSGVHCPKSDFFQSHTIEYLTIQKQFISENESIRNSIDSFYKRKLSLSNSKSYFFSYIINSLIKFYKKIIKKLIGNTITEEIGKFNNNRNYLFNSHLGKNTKIYEPYLISDAKIGDYTYVARNASISKVTIGKFCSIGHNFFAGLGIHPTNGISTHPMFYSTSRQNGITFSGTDKYQERMEINIGNDVFIGANVLILDGITIGDGAIIGAGSVVSKDIPPYAIAVGAPIKVIKYRFSSNYIEALQKIKWWDFNEIDLRNVEKYFFDIDKFIIDREQ